MTTQRVTITVVVEVSGRDTAAEAANEATKYVLSSTTEHSDPPDWLKIVSVLPVHVRASQDP